MVAENSCVKCQNELTCGYSMLATTGERDESSNNACVLGMKSNGDTFFKKEAPKE